jgi:hypothetical protein
MEKEKLRIDLKEAPWMECSEGNKVFETKVLFKRISPLLSPTGKEEFVPLETIVCDKCGKVPKFFYERATDIPEDLRSDCSF